jgi:hypothetical protein
MRWRSAGRGVLRWGVWLLLGWVFVRGVVSFLPAPPAEAARPEPEPTAAESEPAGLRAVPDMFAQEYLSWNPGGVDDHAARLRPYLARGLDRQAGWAPAGDDAGQQVQQTWVYAVRQASSTRWQVTVAARVQPFRNTETVEKVTENKETKEVRRTEREALPPQTLYLMVPLGQTDGGWAVYDYPTLLPPPSPGEFAEPIAYGKEVSDAGGQVRALLTDFFHAYLSGGNLTYYLAPGARVRPMPGGWTFQSLSGLQLMQADDGTYALAAVEAQEAGSRARYTYRYTVKLATRDGRPYIAELMQKGE